MVNKCNITRSLKVCGSLSYSEQFSKEKGFTSEKFNVTKQLVNTVRQPNVTQKHCDLMQA